MNIDDMPAGPEMNQIVTTKVLRWQWYNGRGTAGPSYWENELYDFVNAAEFTPSTDIHDAWKVDREGWQPLWGSCHPDHPIGVGISRISRDIRLPLVGVGNRCSSRCGGCRIRIPRAAGRVPSRQQGGKR